MVGDWQFQVSNISVKKGKHRKVRTQKSEHENCEMEDSDALSLAVSCQLESGLNRQSPGWIEGKC